jgi:PHD/YefM family antitoxin component YafN of YafNO toxin-antitoxin module
MNTMTIAELKRRGMAAIEEGLTKGPIHIMKRNQPSAVIVNREDFLFMETMKLSTQSEQPLADQGMTALQWLLSVKSLQTQSRAEIDAYLEEERDSWESFDPREGK